MHLHLLNWLHCVIPVHICTIDQCSDATFSLLSTHVPSFVKSTVHSTLLTCCRILPLQLFYAQACNHPLLDKSTMEDSASRSLSLQLGADDTEASESDSDSDEELPESGMLRSKPVRAGICLASLFILGVCVVPNAISSQSSHSSP